MFRALIPPSPPIALRSSPTCSAATCLPPPLATKRPPPSSLYEVLRVNRTATITEIKAAYRSLAKVYHPDADAVSLGTTGREFMQIHDAYETLSDPAARAVYDLTLGFGGRRKVQVQCGRPTRRWETDQCW